ncbi:hypothetical protein IFM89_015210 [Coptis chinensis]|uniref:WAT1-related protein n=1 Tax=Coptis chinensis TaxID=261450 RepID=A0A835H3F1_9MAGN|nr:hypothetical protein IFM89_015210 [Coptis chinensis]
MTRQSFVSEKMKFFLALVALQFFYAGFHIVSRLALNMGISKVVYPIYRNIIAILLLGPFAYFLENNVMDGFFDQKRKATTYFLFAGSVFPSCTMRAGEGSHLKEGWVGKGVRYHCKYRRTGLGVVFTCLAIACPGLAGWCSRDLWLLGSFFLFKHGAFTKEGPVSVAVFQPLQTVLVAVMASLVLGDQLYSGSIVGSIFIMSGLYSVLWGKSEEKRMDDQEKEDMLTTHLLDEEIGKTECPTLLSNSSPQINTIS